MRALVRSVVFVILSHSSSSSLSSSTLMSFCLCFLRMQALNNSAFSHHVIDRFESRSVANNEECVAEYFKALVRANKLSAAKVSSALQTMRIGPISAMSDASSASSLSLASSSPTSVASPSMSGIPQVVKIDWGARGTNEHPLIIAQMETKSWIRRILSGKSERRERTLYDN